MGSFVNKTIDDAGSSSITYEPASVWTHLKGQAGAFGGTLSTVISPHSFRVTFKFPEPAIAFYYYGSGGKGSQGICIDCDIANPRPGLLEVINAPDTNGKEQVLLWSKRFNTSGIHTVYINGAGLSDDDEGHAELYVDRFVLEVPSSSTSSGGGSGGSSTTSSSRSQTTQSTSASRTSTQTTPNGTSGSGSTTVSSTTAPLTSESSTPTTLNLLSNSGTGLPTAVTTAFTTAQPSATQTNNAGRMGTRAGAYAIGGLMFMHAVLSLYL